MILFDGTYRLGAYSGKSTRPADRKGPSWRVRIFDLSAEAPGVRRLRSVLVLTTRQPENLFPSKCANLLGTRIFRDFNLEAKNVLWIEQGGDMSQDVRVAVFRPKRHFGPQVFYSVDWRPLQPNERLALQRFVPEVCLPCP